MKRKIISQIVFIFSLVDFIYAQPIDSLLIEALHNNLLIKSFDYKIKSSEQKILQQTLPAPEISLEFNQFDLNRFDIWNNSISNNITFTQMFPLGGKLKSMTELNKINIKITREQYNSRVNQIFSEISKKYYELFLVEKKIELLLKQIDLLTQNYNYYKELYTINRIPLSSLLLLKNEITTLQIDLVNLKKERKNKNVELCFLLGRNFDDTIRIQKELTLPLLNLNDEQIKELIKSNPNLNRMKFMLEMNKKEVESIKRELYPDLMLSGMIMQMPKGMILTTKTTNQTINQNRFNIMFGVMGSITLPFVPWSRKSLNAKTEEIENLTKSYEHELNNMERELSSMARQSLIRMKSNLEILSQLESETIPNYEKLFQLKLKSLEVDETSILQLIEISRMLLMEKMKYWMFYTEYLMEVSELNFLTGGRLL